MNWLERDMQEIKASLSPFEKEIRGNKFLVTGGAGFLGSWFCDALLSLGGKVVCVDNFSAGSGENISHLSENKNFTLVKTDIMDFNPEEKFDYIIHMASIASPPLYQKVPIETLDAGVLATRKMLELSDSLKVKGFLFTSTSEVYGNPPADQIPTKESYYGYVNSYGPRSMYDESKRCAEAYCYSFWKQKAVPARIARIFNTYGPRLDTKNPTGYGRALIKFVYQAINNQPISMYGDGKQTRSFCYATDQVCGLIKLLLTPNIDGEVVNIGNGTETDIKELIGLTVRLANSSSETVESEPDYNIEDDPRRRRPDTTKARQLLGWEPKISLEEGLRRTIEWVKNKS